MVDWYVSNIVFSSPPKIKWDLRYEVPHNEQDVYAYVAIDGVDFLIQEPIPFSSGWYSHKFKHAGLRYIIATSLFTGEITYVEGPFPCGHWSDVRIFRNNLKDHLLPGEMVVADRGYRGDPSCITPYDAYDNHVKYLMGVARARHEGVNAMFKQFRILKDMYRHDLRKHSWVFKAVSLLVQLRLIEGSRVYQILDFTIPNMTNKDVCCRRNNLVQVFFGNNPLTISCQCTEENNSNGDDITGKCKVYYQQYDKDSDREGRIVVYKGLVEQEETKSLGNLDENDESETSSVNTNIAGACTNVVS